MNKTESIDEDLAARPWLIKGTGSRRRARSEDATAEHEALPLQDRIPEQVPGERSVQKGNPHCHETSLRNLIELLMCYCVCVLDVDGCCAMDM